MNDFSNDAAARRLLTRGVSRRTVLLGGARGVALAGMVGSVGSSVLGCVPDESGSGSSTISPGGTLLAGVASDPDSLDPQKSSLAVAAVIYSGIFSRLLNLEEDGSFTPSLAESWSTPDDSTYVFTLRDDVTFHNGAPLKPEDVVYTFDRIRDKKVGATYAGDFASLESVEATGTREVTFRLSQPYAPFLANLANRGHILNRAAVDENDPSLEPIGTGPFALDGWEQGRELRLVRNDQYFTPKRPYLDGVTFRFRPLDQGRVTALKARELDWVDGIPPQSVGGVRSDPALKYISSSTTGKPEFIFLNTKSDTLQDKALRQAICWAIDRSEIAKAAFFDAVEPGAVEFGKSSRWYGEDDPYADAPNPDKVRELLSQAGVPDGGVSLDFPAWTSGPDAARTAQVIQQQLEPYNIDVNIQKVEISVWIKRLFDGDFDMTLAFQEQLVDPDNFWSLFFTSDAAQNVTGYHNPVVDDLVKRAATATDFDERRRLYGKIRATVLNDAPVLFTAYLPLHYVARSEVLGVEISPTQDPRFVNVGLS